MTKNKNAVHTDGQGRIAIWDGWRGLAILLVLLGHFYNFEWITEDRLGVDIFFVLSGMLMSNILFEQRLSLRDFYIRRFSRILPVFVVCTLTMFLFASLVNSEFKVSEVVANLFFVRAYLPFDPGMWDTTVPVGHFWSLFVEEHAYVIMSFMTLFIMTPRNAAVLMLLLAAVAIAISFNYYYTTPTSKELLPLLARTETALSFVFFSAGYGLLKRQHDWTFPSWIPVVLTVLAAMCYLTTLPLWLQFAVSPVLLAIIVNHLHEVPAQVSAILSNRFFRLFGMLSYSIYLWQQIFYQSAYKLPGGKLTACLGAISLGAISFYFLEKPLRHWINNRWSPNPTYNGEEGFTGKK